MKAVVVAGLLVMPVAGQTLLEHLDGASVGMRGSPYGPPLLADLDGDGAPDLVQASLQCGFVVWFGDGRGGFESSVWIDPTATTTSPGFVNGVGVGDIEGDGDEDVLVCRTGVASFLFVNHGNRQFVRDRGGRIPVLASAWLAAFLDVDADGDLDVFVGNVNAPRHELLINDGTGYFSSTVGRLAGGGSWPVYVQPADLNGDGFQDLVYAGGLNGKERNAVYLNDGTGALSVRVEVGASDLTRGLATGDFDGDGDLDLAFGNGSGVDVELNDGLGGFFDGSHLLPAALRGLPSMRIVFGDFDLDGYGDLLLGLAAPGRLALLLGDGHGGFVDRSARVRHVAPDTDTMLAGDFDQDGDLDVVVEMFGLAPKSAVLSNLSRQIHGMGAPVRGSSFRIGLASRAGRWMFVGLSGRSTRVSIPPLGVVVLDPATAAFAPPVSFVTTGFQSMWIPVPANSALFGKTIFAQGLDLDLSMISNSHVTNWFDTKIQ